MASASDRVVEEVRATYQAGGLPGCARSGGCRAVAERPDDPALLWPSGVAGLELDDEDALGYLERAVAVAPDDADAWRELGDARTVRSS